MTTTALWMFAACLGGLSIAFLAAWEWHRRIRNGGVADIAWTFGIMLGAWFYAVAGTGAPARRWAVVAMSSAWGLRLGVHLARRVLADPEEEPRYADLRRTWGAQANMKMFLFFQVQALVAALCTLPFLFPSFNAEPMAGGASGWPFGVVESAGLFSIIFGLTGVAVADAQLAAFKRGEKKNPSTVAGTKVCRVGLWRISRHPNYFFECFVWTGFGLFSVASPAGWIGLLAPAMIIYFLLYVTGIPATEAQAVRSKGDEYLAYQREVSVLVPWFPSENPAPAGGTAGDS